MLQQGNIEDPYLNDNLLTSILVPFSPCQYSPDTTVHDEPVTLPFLEVKEQPCERVRFRYLTELQGTPHGPLVGKSSHRHHKTFPTVKLNNFDGEAKIYCWLVDQKVEPHCHRLVIRGNKSQTKENSYEPHCTVVNRSNNYTAVFENMVIIHSVKKDIENYYQKLLKWEKRYDGEATMDSFCNSPTDCLPKSEEKMLANRIRSIDKNTVYLYFEAYQIQRNGMMKLCEPVLSGPIRNLKSKEAGELKIYRASHSSGPKDKQTEVLLFVSKMSKDVEIKFSSINSTAWEANGSFITSDIHCNVGVAFKTPLYPYNLTSQTTVVYKLYREWDGMESNVMEFTYLPSQDAVDYDCRKRKLPKLDGALVESLYLPSLPNVDPMEILEEMPSASFNSSDLSGTIRALECSLNVQNLVEFMGTDGINISDDSDDEKILKPTKSNLSTKLQEKLCLSLRTAHKAVIENDLEKLSESMNFVKKHYPKYLDVTDTRGRTLLHVSTELNRIEMVKYLIGLGLNVNTVNMNGNTVLHISSQQQDAELLKIVMPHSSVDKKNIDGLNCLHLAVRENSSQNVCFLLENTDLVDSMESKTGNTALHTATMQKNYSVMKQLIKMKCNVSKMNFADQTPLQLAVLNNDVAATEILLKAGASPTEVVRGEGEDDDNSLSNDSFQIIVKKLKEEKDNEKQSSENENPPADSTNDDLWNEDILDDLSSLLLENGRWVRLAKHFGQYSVCLAHPDPSIMLINYIDLYRDELFKPGNQKQQFIDLLDSLNLEEISSLIRLYG